MQDDGEDVDEDRLYFLELAVRQRLGEDLTESELLDLEDFDGQEKDFQDTETSATQLSSTQDKEDYFMQSAKENNELPNISGERSPSVPDDDNGSEHGKNKEEKDAIPKVSDEGSASIPDYNNSSEHARSLDVQDTDTSPTRLSSTQDKEDYFIQSAKENNEPPNISGERSLSVPDDDNGSEHGKNKEEKVVIPKVSDEGSASIPDYNNSPNMPDH
jgi:hypothetical protein